MGLASILGAAQRSVLVEAFSTISCPHLIIDEMTASCDTISGSVECLIRIETTLPVTEPDPRVSCVITERHVWGDGRYNRFIITVYNPAGAREREVSPAGFPEGSTALRFLTSEREFTSRSQRPVSGRKALG